MPYEAKTDWKYDDLVTEKDMNRIEQGLKDAHVPAYQPLTLNPGLQVVEVENDTPFRMGEVKGRTLINMLGRVGDCENTGDWSAPGPSTLALSTERVYGSHSIEATGTNASGGFGVRSNSAVTNLDKHYVAVAHVKNISAQSVVLSFANVTSSGTSSIKSSEVVTSDQFTYVYVAITPEELAGKERVELYVRGLATAAGQKIAADGIGLYEISQAEYEAIGSMKFAQVAEKYPYVDGMTNVTNPYAIVTGGNLLPPFYEWTTGEDGIKKIVSPYRLGLLGATKKTDVQYYIYGLAGETLTLSVEHDGRIGVNAWGAKGEQIGGQALVPYTDEQSVTFTLPAETARISIHFGNVTGTGENDFLTNCYFKNSVLTISTDAKPFVPQQRSILAFETELTAHPVDGNTPDKLFIGDDGLPYVLEKWKKVALDGSLGWKHNARLTGYKEVYVDLPYDDSVGTGTAYITKYNGELLEVKYPTTEGDQYYGMGSAAPKRLFLSVANTDSGWGQDYNPTQDEIKAYFLGWKMYDASGADPTAIGTYNRTDGLHKGWTPLQSYDGNSYEGGYNGSGTPNTIPSTANTTHYSVRRTWQQYRLQYLKAKPTVEPVRNYEMAATLTAGSNMVEVGSGIVIREKANPGRDYTGTSHVQIGRVDYGSATKFRVAHFLDVFRNSHVDTTKWRVFTIDDGASFGNERLIAAPENFDFTAVYRVTYTMLDPTLAAPFSGIVAANLRGTVSDLVRTFRSVESGMSGDVALTAADVGAATKAEFDDLKKNAVGKNGDSVIEGMLSMSKTDGPHLQLVGATSSFGEWYVNNERKGWFGVGNRNEPSTIRLASEKGPLAMQSTTDAVHIHGPGGVFLEGRRVVEELDLVKQSVVDGKGLVAEAINGKGGGPVSAYNTFPELAAGINRISTGGYYPIWVDEKVTDEYQVRNIDLVTITNPKIVMFSPFENVSNPCYFKIENHYGVNWGDSKAYASLRMVDDAERIIYLHDLETNYEKAFSYTRYLKNTTFRRDYPHTTMIRIDKYYSDPEEEARYVVPKDFNFNGPVKIRLALKSAKFLDSSSYSSYIQAVLRGNIVWG